MSHDDILTELTDETIKVLINNNVISQDYHITTYTFIKQQLNKALDIGTIHLANSKNHNNKAVIQIDKFGNEIRSFKSIKLASRALKIDASTITKALKGKGRLTAGGFYWKYKTNQDE